MQFEDKNIERLWFRLTSQSGKAMKDFGMVEDGDRILIGLSGGKDSLALVELLGERQKIFKPRFSVEAVHITMENIPYQSDIDYLREFCGNSGVPFHHITTHFDIIEDKRKTPCFLCSWNRRKKLFDFAQENGFTKIALGHHLDDIAKTLLMNLTFQGAFSTMPPKLRMKKMDLSIIRPLCLIREKDLRTFAEARGYHKQTKNCPHEQATHRADMNQVLELMEQMNPDAIQSIWGAMTNVQEEYLPTKITKNGK